MEKMFWGGSEIIRNSKFLWKWIKELDDNTFEAYKNDNPFDFIINRATIGNITIDRTNYFFKDYNTYVVKWLHVNFIQEHIEPWVDQS